MRNYKGVFITFESTAEGLGKTTQAKLLADSLKQDGYEVVLTREPGGTAIGEEIRKMLLNPNNGHLSKATELFLFMADRAQNYKEILKPSLRDGKVVICDRYVDSTLIYQGAGRGWKSAFLWRLHHATTGSLLPDLTVVLDGEPHINRKENNPDRFEREGTLFFQKVKDTMLHLASKDRRYEVLNANVPQDELTKNIRQVLAERRLIGNKSFRNNLK